MQSSNKNAKDISLKVRADDEWMNNRKTYIKKTLDSSEIVTVC